MIGTGELKATAAYLETPDDIGGKALHNTPLQILIEHGLFGALAFLLLLIDFWRINGKLRQRKIAELWTQVTGGKFDLPGLATGLEGAMVAYLATGLFYNQLYIHIPFSLLVLNRLFYHTAVSTARGHPRPRLAPPR